MREALNSLRLSWRCREVRTGAEALELLEQPGERPELVLVDMELPDMSGLQVIRAARQYAPGTPVLVYSSLASSDAVLAAIRAGARGYVNKGDSALSLARAVQCVLTGEHPISPSLAQCLFNLVSHEESAAEPESVGLTRREVQLLRLLSRGCTGEEAASQMGIGVATVYTFSRRIYQKLRVNSKVKAIVAARERGWI